MAGTVDLPLFGTLIDCMMNFFQNFSQAVAKFPGRIMSLEFSHVADPPHVVANTVSLLIAIVRICSTIIAKTILPRDPDHITL